jgi:hypothetical protein
LGGKEGKGAEEIEIGIFRRVKTMQIKKKKKNV